MSWLFRSIKFNVILFVIIALMSALGTFIPQTADNADKVARFMANNPTFGNLFKSWGLFDIYHTPLFAALLGLMAFDVIVCKLRNKPPDPGLVQLPEEQSKEDVSLKALKMKPHRLEGFLSGTVAQLTRTISQQLQRNRYTVKHISLAGGGTVLVASRHRLQRWGSYVSHISIVVILLGAMIKSLLGFETMLPILEGQSANVAEQLFAAMKESPLPEKPALADRLNDVARWPGRMHNALQRLSLNPIAHWNLAVEKFSIDFYLNSTTPSNFSSKVQLFDQDQRLADTTLRVNEPLDVRRVRFYQASWGVTGMIRGAVLQVGDRTISPGMREHFRVPGQPWTARIEHYLPDFIIGPDGEPSTASLEWKNPVLLLGFYNRQNTRIGSLAVSAPSPVTPPDAEPWGVFFLGGGHMRLKPPIQVLKVEPILFSGVQVSYDPGYPIIVTGVVFMLLGLMALFYLHQRRVLIFIRPGAKGDPLRVDVGGWSSRGKKEYAHEFQAMFRSLGLKAVSAE